ncbi:MAG: MinD/ParA family protein [Candidatus Nitrohelix vancouverensis]|uniref:MinD/ParA family protein n=1 Tax=Candidatus Nitrohelix vancouverensis TaxID=2705534 RepID=A0A7T0C311_9BACT|nr:MAG: MinD/ParA family protein [Candidatus Nitrohelix vancouverensis]
MIALTSTAKIIAVGGGKGGIGKSVVSVNIASGLALAGHHVVLVDTDFGASNLHALLGISNPQKGFQDIFNNTGVTSDSLLLDTGIDNLKFISGAGDNPGSANIGQESVEAVIAMIRNLQTDVVVLDMGPGTNFNVIDFFNISDQNIVLTTPEMTSVMKTFSFIRASLFRSINKKFADNEELQRMVDHSNPLKADIETYTVDLLKEKLAQVAPERVEEVDAAVQAFKPGLVVNRARNRRDIQVGDNLIRLVHKYLNVDVKYLGYIIESDRVRDSVDDMIPFLIKDPQSKPSENIQQIIGALTNTDLHFIKQDGNIFVSKQVRLGSGWGA